ncbi:MAG TPA: histidine--tRNA ligase [Acholeplasma sp.]|nr:histidine--tRNA ligase [Acholeplasma sp.]
MSFVKVKGTYDVLPNESKRWQALEKFVRDLFNTFKYEEIRTPMMEYSNVFHRENEQSDMVTKETYNFKDKGDRDLTLRPEGTAGVIRSYVENKLYANNRLTKLYYIGPNFRYERPQKGRYRQFMQFGVEAVGSSDPFVDAEVIFLAYETICRLGLKGVKVKLNSIGDDLSKSNYKKVLVDYLTPFKDQLSADSIERLNKNPLRILDSKAPEDKKIVENAPLPINYLSDAAKEHFNKVKEALDALNVPYIIDGKIVRGLDYYSHTVFEIEAAIPGFGAQNTLGGGGRYESLVEELGGPRLGAIGFAFGMERLLYALEMENIQLVNEERLDAYFIYFDEPSKSVSFKLLNELRQDDFKVDMSYLPKSFKSQLKEALDLKAKYLVIIGENELKDQMVQLKNTDTQIQELIPMNQLKEKLGVL